MPGCRQCHWVCFNDVEHLPMPPCWEHFQQPPSSNHPVYRYCDSVSKLCPSEHTFRFGYSVLTNANLNRSLFATKAKNYPRCYFWSAYSQVTANYCTLTKALGLGGFVTIVDVIRVAYLQEASLARLLSLSGYSSSTDGSTVLWQHDFACK